MELNSNNVQLVMAAFRAVETRDYEGLVALYHPDIEFHWPPSLHYGGEGSEPSSDRQGRSWSDVWERLQPSGDERSMSPHVVGANEHEVAVVWRQRGKTDNGESIDTPVFGLYEVREGKLARAQMFYFDPVAVGRFLDRAEAGAEHESSGPDSPPARVERPRRDL